MSNSLLPSDQLRDIVSRALAEDIGNGDITTLATIPPLQQAHAHILAKAAGVIAGLPVAQEVFRQLDAGIKFDTSVADGAHVTAGTVVASLAGSAGAILTGERTALNFLMRASGIATLTAAFVDAVAGTKARIVDTRKTAPGLRLLDKYAVRMGGGHNHRFGLYDGILIKDNHIRAAGGIAPAVAQARATAHHLLRIEVEVTNTDELQQALVAGADCILLDNMTPTQHTECVKIVAGHALTEASGGITLENVRAIAESGVDIISVGFLTHSATALNLSLELI
jgi:nicotinate-nucleotide pyrophosphorylase (carboxylating)